VTSLNKSTNQHENKSLQSWENQPASKVSV
jgi:hypothetical protein